MAIEFNAGFNSLITDLRDAGLEPVVISSTGGKNPRAAEVKVENALSVHWDRDSRSVWVEGQWDRAARVEKIIRRHRTKRRIGRSLARPVVARRLIIAALAAGALAFSSLKLIDRGAVLSGKTAAAVEPAKSAAETESP